MERHVLCWTLCGPFGAPPPQNRKIPECFGWEGTLKLVSFQPPQHMGRENFHQSRCWNDPLPGLTAFMWGQWPSPTPWFGAKRPFSPLPFTPPSQDVPFTWRPLGRLMFPAPVPLPWLLAMPNPPRLLVWVPALCQFPWHRDQPSPCGFQVNSTCSFSRNSQDWATLTRKLEKRKKKK